MLLDRTAAGGRKKLPSIESRRSQGEQSMSQDNKNEKKQEQAQALTPELFLEAIKHMSKANQEALVAAMAEQKKPYVDPNIEANREASRLRRLQLEAETKAYKDNAQGNCNHKNPDDQAKSAIFWMPFKGNGLNGQPKGVCNYCDAVFEPSTDPDKHRIYNELLRTVNQKHWALWY